MIFLRIKFGQFKQKYFKTSRTKIIVGYRENKEYELHFLSEEGNLDVWGSRFLPYPTSLCLLFVIWPLSVTVLVI